MMYAISLGIFTLVMVYTKSQQPALMYIIPSLFLTTFITAGMRKEWGSKLSMSSVIEGEGYNPSDESSDKQPGEASARGMARFDPKQFNKTEDHQNFKKFEDDPADDVRDAEDGHAEFKEEVKESSQN